MTMYLVESWQTYANVTDMTRRWVFQQGNGGQLVTGGCLLDGSQISYCNTHFPPLTTLMMGFELTCQAFAPSVTNSSMVHTLQDGETNANNQVGLGVNPDGTLSVFFGSNFTGLGGTTLANGTTALALNTKYWIEWKVVYHPTAGSVEVRIDGNAEILLTGINTVSTSFGWVERLSICAGANAKHLYGGLYIGDGAEGWQGPSTVQRIALTGDTAQKDFVPSSGTANYSLVNDLNTYTSYVSSGNLGDEDLYSLGSLSYVPNTIRAVHVQAQAINTVSANLIKSLIPVMSMSGSTRGSGPKMVGSSYPAAANWWTSPTGVFTVAPDGTAWTAAKLAACSAGMRVAPWRAGINFRATATYVTDAPSNTYCLNDVYPVTRGGWTFGWDVAGTGFVALDRSTGAPDYYAGINSQQNTGTQRTFTLDLPAPGRYAVKALFGDNAQGQDIFAQFLDGSTVLQTVDTRTMSSKAFNSSIGACAIDASGRCSYGVFAYAEFHDWIEVNITGTKLGVKIGMPVSFGSPLWSCITHLEVVALDYTATPSALAPTVNVAGVFAEALISSDAAPADVWASTETTDTLAAIGYPGFIGPNGFLFASETPDTLTMGGYQPIGVRLAATEPADTFSAFIRQPLQGPWLSTEATDTFAALGFGRGADGAWSSTEATDALAAAGQTPIAGTFVTTENPDRFTASGVGVTQTRRRRRTIIT